MRVQNYFLNNTSLDKLLSLILLGQKNKIKKMNFSIKKKYIHIFFKDVHVLRLIIWKNYNRELIRELMHKII